jgi:dipeptidyl aminopeptidase/acylaminoacyl peptidase
LRAPDSGATLRAKDLGGSTVTSIRHLWLGLACALFAAPALAAPLEAYGKLPNIEDAAISGGGTEVAFIVTDGEQRRVVVQDVASKQFVFVGGLGQAKVRDIRFAGDQHLIITSSVTGKPIDVMADRSEWLFAADLNIATKKLHTLMEGVPETMNVIEGMPIVRIVDGQPALFLEGVEFVAGQGRTTLFRVDLARGTSKPILIGFNDTYHFVVGHDGQPLAQSLYNRSSGKWTLKVATANGGWRDAVTRQEPIDPPDVLGLGREARSIIVTDDADHGFAWRELSVDTGALGEAVPAEEGDGTLHDPLSGRLIGYSYQSGDQSGYRFFDPADQRFWDAVVKALAPDRVSLVSWSNDRSKILVRADSTKMGPAYALVDLAARKASWLGGEYEQLKAEDISSVRPLKFKAADGLELTGYVTLPNGREAKGLPLIVFPHGGPAARDTLAFDWWAQAMASRGYAVLQVNFRGSDGFGWDFTKAGFGEWGRKMQSDLSDGVRHLAGQGTIDPKRVCIVGGSYGGYAALAGVTLEKDVYRCAVSFGGVADLQRMVGYDRGRGGKSSMRYWTRFMGAADMNDPILAKYSPALQAAKASAPILLIHGKDDTVVPLAQSQEMADALKKAGKPVELVVQNNADHWLSLGETRLQMLQATMAFVEKHNPPQ